MSMYELVYVLTIESFVFGLLGLLIVGQRWDITQWPDNATWPVFSTSMVLIFAYALFQIVLCCAIAIGRFGSLTHSLMDACARSAGRLVTSVILAVCYVTALIVIFKKQEIRQCLTIQLYGTSCASGSAIFSLFSIFDNVAQQIYFSVLIPVWVFVAALIVTAAGMCKDAQRSSRGRLMCMNITYILVYNVNYIFHMNTRCEQACKGVAVTQPIELIVNKEILYLTGVLSFVDILAETFLMRRTVYHFPVDRRLLEGKLEDVDNKGIHISGLLVFCVLRVLQLIFVVVFNWSADELIQLPWQLMTVHVIFASVLCLLDIVQVVIEYAHTQQTLQNLVDQTAHQTALVLKSDASVAEIVQSNRSHKPFEVDTAHMQKTRKKFNLTFAGRSRWPVDFEGFATDKKST